MDKIAVLLEDVQSNQTKQMAMILTQGSSASEKRKLEEQMATLKKSYFEAVMVRWRESDREYFVYIYIPLAKAYHCIWTDFKAQGCIWLFL